MPKSGTRFQEDSAKEGEGKDALPLLLRRLAQREEAHLLDAAAIWRRLPDGGTRSERISAKTMAGRVPFLLLLRQPAQHGEAWGQPHELPPTPVRRPRRCPLRSPSGVMTLLGFLRNSLGW